MCHWTFSRVLLNLFSTFIVSHLQGFLDDFACLILLIRACVTKAIVGEGGAEFAKVDRCSAELLLLVQGGRGPGGGALVGQVQGRLLLVLLHLVIDVLRLDALRRLGLVATKVLQI